MRVQFLNHIKLNIYCATDISMLGSATDLLAQIAYEERKNVTNISRHAKERAKQHVISKEQLLRGNGPNLTVIKKGNTIVTAYHNNTKSAHTKSAHLPRQNQIIQPNADDKIVNENPEIIYSETNSRYSSIVPCTDDKCVGRIIGKEGINIKYLQGLIIQRVGNGVYWNREEKKFTIVTKTLDETLFMTLILKKLMALNVNITTTVRLIPDPFVQYISADALKKVETEHNVFFFRNGKSTYIILNARKYINKKWEQILKIIHDLARPSDHSTTIATPLSLQ
jgi:hypothetical protein